MFWAKQLEREGRLSGKNFLRKITNFAFDWEEPWEMENRKTVEMQLNLKKKNLEKL